MSQPINGKPPRGSHHSPAGRQHPARRIAALAGLFLATAFAPFAAHAADQTPPTGAESGEKISYYRQVRPLLQANCQGCHQPAKPKGGYVMTDFKKLLAGGETEGAAITPGQPAHSSLLKMVVPKDGEIRMPKGKAPLAEWEVALLNKWVAQGAVDDTPADARRHYDAEHPPTYTQPPVISALDYSPDGSLLALAGFHEVLLYDATGENLKGRLVGLSERVQSLRFSPDGQSLAVAGGDPGRLGEIQVWNVAKRQLSISAPITFDTLYGVSWSPDSKLIAFGCSDFTVRAIEAASGKQVLQMGSHSDWALSTAFSVKGDHIISGGRDMTVKLTEVAAQRFVDNVTSITPGALKGGVLAVATHPTLEHIVTAGSDGLPKVYRIFREAKREIGDDAQFIGDLFPLEGRVFCARFSADGRRIACGSSLDGRGEVVVASYDFTNDVPKNLRDIMGKVPGSRSADERKQLEDYKKSGVREIARATLPTGVYGLAFAPDGKTIAVAGSDGKVRLLGAADAKVTREFVSVPLTPVGPATNNVPPAWAGIRVPPAEPALTPESLPAGQTVVALEIQPAQIRLTSRNEYAQLLVVAKLQSGDTVDVTRLVKFQVPAHLALVSPRGVCHPEGDGIGQLTATLGEKSATVSVNVTGQTAGYRADFIRDVSPIIAKAGCNAGTCHGAKDGKAGFKLSLRGYDPETDVRAFTDDLASRRINLASPDDSLMLLKAVAEVPHEGGRRATVESAYYQVLRQWIASGAVLDMKSPRVTKIDLFPANPVVQQIGAKQQMRVLATYADGLVRDVTAESFIESGNADVAVTDVTGLVATQRRGEAAILARYQGNYTATTLTVMGDRTGFAWENPPVWSKIDELVAAKWQRMKIAPSGLCTDLDFIRRASLDLTGLPPSAEETQAFVADHADVRAKREALVDRLIASPEFVDHWANKWADLLQCNSKFLGREGAEALRDWIRDQVAKNVPYDQFVRSVLTASGSNREHPAAAYWKILRTPTEAMENTTHLFLATRFNCNKCHDHPFERWTQDQYYNMTAYFAQVSLKEDAEAKGKRIGGTDVEGSKPLYEIISDATSGDVKHDRTGKVSPPVFPYPAKNTSPDTATRREKLAAWITTPDNRYFASSYVNRLWGYLLGAGIIEPLDDTRAGNPPTNPELLDHLTKEFIAGGFDTRKLIAAICKSRTYQLELHANKWNEDDHSNYSHALARRLPAETLFDAVFKVTGSTPAIPGAKPGQRAQELFDSAQDVGSGLLATLGRPARQSACECERSADMRLDSVMALLSGPTVSTAIDDPKNALADLVAKETDNHKLADAVFLRVLNRPATEAEITNTLHVLTSIQEDHLKITNQLTALEVKFAPSITEATKRREAAIAAAKAGLQTYEEDTKFLRAEVEQRRNAGIDTANGELRRYESLLPSDAALWEIRTQPAANPKTIWTPVDPTSFTATDGAKLVRQADGSILSTERNGRADYRIAAQTKLTKITGFMLEVLPDDSLPRFGPGRANDGNFVLSEIDLKWNVGTNNPEKPIKLTEARADFSQNDYPVAQAIDGIVEPGRNGWAVAGAPGIQRHVATFKLETPLTSTNGLSLRFRLQQKYSDSFLIGRFRLYITDSAEPLEFGLPAAVADALRAPAGQRKPEQAAAIIDYYRAGDIGFWRHKQAVVDARADLPVDPRFTVLKKALATAEQPILLDPFLVQLREDVRYSTKQLENQRLTVVQDLAWALINNASFLFNH